MDLTNIVPYIAAILYTVIIFLLNGNGMDYLSRLVSSALYYMLAVGAMYEMLQLMGCRVLDYYIDVTIFTYLLSCLYRNNSKSWKRPIVIC